MVEINNLVFHAGTFNANVNMSVSDEYFVLLGMTGSGKTLLLECLCGLRSADSGSVSIDGVEVFNAEPRNRHIGYVPQEGALFDHLTVYKNIAFSLFIQNTDKAIIDELVLETAKILGITHLLGRAIKGLSGGERQRVALGRAIIRKPSLLLLDEPVCALDESTRESICQELKKLQRNLNIPVIHVCHSFEEASYLADKIGIIRNGRLIQCGTLKEIQLKPSSMYIGKMMRLENIYNAEVNGQLLSINKNTSFYCAGGYSGSVQCVIRPWQVKLLNDTTKNTGDNLLKGVITDILFTATAVKIKIEGSITIMFYLLYDEIPTIKRGMLITVTFPHDAIHIFPDKEL
jgi:molybdate/tungstate transport system ATP-binding protein